MISSKIIKVEAYLPVYSLDNVEIFLLIAPGL